MTSLFTVGRIGYNLFSIGQQTGIIGWQDVAGQLLSLVPKMAIKAMQIDHDALDDMVEEAKSRVPVDSGRLLNGITGEVTDDYCEFRASALRDAGGKPGEDYAHFVEFGTQASTFGTSVEYQARDGLFSVPADATSAFPTGDTVTRRRKARRTHPGTPAEPFFYPAAEAILARRGEQMSDVIAQVAGGDGWDME